jgi:hypothetical protein
MMGRELRRVLEKSCVANRRAVGDKKQWRKTKDRSTVVQSM